ncbi:MAG TPA: hypothetical protein VN025_13110 [Candidatus Dormibacteraeota bacterium]|jgi:hypothetical protein|nr:hypothetical protein [Candidatus Dormibacteraeota bacterium]
MNRCLKFSLAISMTISTLAIPLRAASNPRAGKTEQATVKWTNDELEKLRPLGLISIVGQPSIAEEAITAALPPPYSNTQDPEWYAEQAAKLREQLESNEAELQRYRQAIEDAKSLKTTTCGINLEEGEIGITLEAGVEILRQRVSETQSELDALHDLARRNDIPPGALRGQ